MGFQWLVPLTGAVRRCSAWKLLIAAVAPVVATAMRRAQAVLILPLFPAPIASILTDRSPRILQGVLRLTSRAGILTVKHRLNSASVLFCRRLGS